MTTSLAITGLGALSSLGASIEAHREAFAEGRSGLCTLDALRECAGRFNDLRAGWIQPRARLKSRKWSPLSMAALEVAGQALEGAEWSTAERREATVFFGTSRGSLAGWIQPWPQRRPFKLLAATNTLPAEPAAAVSGHFGIGGPWQVSASGCCSGLDALADAEMWIRSGRIHRALVIAADLPLVTPLLDAYAATGLLALKGQPGMHPGEAASALCLEASENPSSPALVGCDAAAESRAILSGHAADPALAIMLRRATRQHGTPDLVIPHHSGTVQNTRLEASLQRDLFPAPFISYKPWTGHAIGASGLLELCLGAAAIFPLTVALTPDPLIFKFASALGGRHSLACLKL